MKYILTIIMLIFLVACDNSDKDKAEKKSNKSINLQVIPKTIIKKDSGIETVIEKY